MSKRKDIRMTLKHGDAELFNRAKVKAEQSLGYSLRDAEFAARIIQNHVRGAK